MIRAILLQLLLLCSAAACDARQQKSAVAQVVGDARGSDSSKLPALTGRVVDHAAILSAETKALISTELARLERRTSDQLVLLTLSSLGDRSIEEMGLALGRSWGVGQRDLNNGVLLIIAPNDRKVRIEVGYGLEGLLTDKVAASIINEHLLPELRQGAYDKAALAGVTQIIATLESNLRRPQPKRRES